jgi:general secretion pathway protein F
MLARPDSLPRFHQHRFAEAYTLLRDLLGFTIPTESLGVFFDSLSVYLRSGRSLADTLIRESASSIDPELRRICVAIAPKIRSGHSLCECLRPYSRRFPPIVMAVLRVGEASGGLADACQRLADGFNQVNSFERKFRYGVYDPRLLLLMVCLIDFVYLIIVNLSSNHPEKSIAVATLTITGKVAVTSVVISACYLGGRALLSNLYRWRVLRYLVDATRLLLPRVGRVSRNLAAARWARSFAILCSAGVNISHALDVSAPSSLNYRYEYALRRAARDSRKGVPVSVSMARGRLIPESLAAVVAACESTGTFDRSMVSVATDMEKEALGEAIHEMNKLVIVGQVILIVLGVAGAIR